METEHTEPTPFSHLMCYSPPAHCHTLPIAQIAGQVQLISFRTLRMPMHQ